MGELEGRAQSLDESVQGLTDAVKELTTRTRRNRRAIRWVVASLVVDLVLTVAGTWVFSRVVANEHDSAALRAEVLCPLYEVFLQADTPQRRAALEPDQRDAYLHAIAVITAGSHTLGCDRQGGER